MRGDSTCPGIKMSSFFCLTLGRLRAFSKNPLLKGELLNLSRQKKPVRNNDMAANRDCDFKGYLFTLWLVDNPGCDRCKQTL
jgi:hypothetical protein